MVSSTQTRNTYWGDGATVSFPITFQFLENSQVSVKLVDTVLNTETPWVEGVEYTLVGGDPASSVLAATAPASTEQVVVYRSTALLQDANYLDTGAFPAETHERVLDKLMMIVQELDYKVANVTPVSTGSVVQLLDQSLNNGDTLLVSNANLELVKRVQGVAGGEATSVIEDGGFDWQKLTLIGISDALSLTLQSAANLKLNGDFTFGEYSALTLMWNSDDSKWIEISRRA